MSNENELVQKGLDKIRNTFGENENAVAKCDGINGKECANQITFTTFSCLITPALEVTLVCAHCVRAFMVTQSINNKRSN